jgi:tetratricopeptide (TPR) repeat protein
VEEFYKKAEELPKISLEDGIPLNGKLADFYYRCQQYEKALPLYKEIMQRESIAPPDEKNLYDCFSYRWGLCLVQMGNIPEAIDKFKVTLKRNPVKEYRLKPLLWLRGLYIHIKDFNKMKEIENQILNDPELRDLYNISPEKLSILLNPRMMEEYIAQIDYRLARGDHWAVIDELRDIRRLHRLIEGRHFIEKLSKKRNLPERQLSADAQKLLSDYDWPGNVRELENIIEKALRLSDRDELIVQDFPDLLQRRETSTTEVQENIALYPPEKFVLTQIQR